MFTSTKEEVLIKKRRNILISLSRNLKHICEFMKGVKKCSDGSSRCC